MELFGAISYGVAAASFFALSALLVVSWQGRKLGGLLLAACILTAIWAVLLAVQSYASLLPLWSIFLTEMLRVGVWLFFLRTLLMSLSQFGAPAVIRLGVPLIWVASVSYTHLRAHETT